MPRYHINPETGKPGVCKAQAGNCRFGNTDTEHYATKEEARNAYEDSQSSFPTTTTPVYLRESAGMYLYEMDDKNEMTAVMHLYGIAEVLETYAVDDKRWQTLRAKLQYRPGVGGALSDFDPEEPSDQDLWPDHEYARDFLNKQVSKQQLLEAVEILHDKIENEYFSEKYYNNPELLMDKYSKRDAYLGFGYIGTRHQHNAEERAKIDKALIEYADNNNMTQDEFFEWANSKHGRFFNDAITGNVTDETIQEQLAKTRRIFQ